MYVCTHTCMYTHTQSSNNRQMHGIRYTVTVKRVGLDQIVPQIHSRATTRGDTYTRK